VTALAASDRSAGKKYAEAANWFSGTPLKSRLAQMTVSPCEPTLPCRIVFSGLDSSVAGEIETAFAKAGYIVVSNSKNHRMDADVPLLVPEVNPESLEVVKTQNYGQGMIVTNPNCTTVGLVMALKPLVDAFGVEQVMVTTMQALSGAGYPGVASLDIIDNVVPFISGEEEKVETEPVKILGVPLKISAHCNRVAVIDGHTQCVSVKLARAANKEEIIDVWRRYRSVPQDLELPMAPAFPLRYFDEERYPQPRLHRSFDKGMVTSIGRLRPCALLNWKFVLMSHNTIRGAAGGAILNAELMVKKGLV
jgi:aspartate-semialdehyde dehydrogenase